MFIFLAFANPVNAGAGKADIAYEGFERAGWNASNTTINKYTPGLDESLPKFFLFTQFQGPHAFELEQERVRSGDYAAKLHWQHKQAGKWNGSIDKIDNTDRKAMFHGQRAASNTTTLWYGFSVYFDSEEVTLAEGQQALFFQLHGARDKNGEPNRVPPVALTINPSGFKAQYAWDPKKLSTSTRGQGQKHVNIPLDMSTYYNRWIDFVVQAKTNPFSPEGELKIWIDGKPMVALQDIQIGYNDTIGLYPSWGWYLTGDNVFRKSDVTLYLDELRQIESDNVTYLDFAPINPNNRIQNNPIKSNTTQINTYDPVSSHKWIKIDDFESESPLSKWTMVDTFNETLPKLDSPQVTEVRQEQTEDNHYLIKKPAAEGVLGNRKALTFTKLPVTIEVGETYTLYARVNVEAFPNNHVYGLSNLSPEGIIENDYNSLEPSLRITDRFDQNVNFQNEGTLAVRKGAWYERIFNTKTNSYAMPMETNTWYEIWTVINNKKLSEGGQQYDVYIRGGSEFPVQQKVYSGADFRMKREMPISYFYATCNGGPRDTPYGNGGVRYDDLYIIPGTVISTPLL